jgi:hypothetical protein
MGGAPNTSANLSCLGLKWHANFWEPRSGQLPVGRQSWSYPSWYAPNRRIHRSGEDSELSGENGWNPA